MLSVMVSFSKCEIRRNCQTCFQRWTLRVYFITNQNQQPLRFLKEPPQWSLFKTHAVNLISIFIPKQWTKIFSGAIYIWKSWITYFCSLEYFTMLYLLTTDSFFLLKRFFKQFSRKTFKKCLLIFPHPLGASKSNSPQLNLHYGACSDIALRIPLPNIHTKQNGQIKGSSAQK